MCRAAAVPEPATCAAHNPRAWHGQLFFEASPSPEYSGRIERENALNYEPAKESLNLLYL
jgi:hypothetical protein